MFIEILNYGNEGCKAKCPTCPQVISGANSGPYADLMFEAFNKLKHKFRNEKISFSLQSDLSELPDDLKKLSFNKKIHSELGCNIQLPFEKKIIKEVFRYLEKTIPNVELSLFFRNRGFLTNYTKDIFELTTIFVSSKIKSLSIACHNNSMRVHIFDEKIDTMFENNVDLFKQVLKIYPAVSFQKSLEENSFSLNHENYKQFQSSLDLRLLYKKLKISERVLSFEESTWHSDDLIYFYKDFFTGELEGKTFDKEKILLAFTEIGVRINHRSVDIKKPIFMA